MEPRQSRGSVRRGLRASCLLASLLVASLAGAAPKPGEALPELSSQDLEGKTHRSQEWRGRRTLLVVLTDKDGGEEMRRWFDTAATQVPDSVHRASVLTFKVPFFVSADSARERAKKKVPEAFWTDTWLDKSGAVGKSLGLASSREPYAIALDERGQVLAVVHGNADSPEARALLQKLSGP
ncbi:hypothetical protein HUA74_02015 [Myxococcus sp. CA051A]|nr:MULTISPECIES: hypothetical protein [unclassified Myxococcus]NTX12446.1 hypothetical protein [Myxococcus sp. CA056]NTX54328.1 hypothetical protein [Myxococcus sp. CA039A]NTX59427.1 hypothetical protein [Myxococcus sp. CA051A]